tara:strand:+ start:231 stop:437 length:207 start_codon:yes stop_codon:yes gene_type:complete
MVEYNPREEEIKVDDTTEEEIWKLKKALDVLFSMLQRGNNLADIQRVANQLASQVQYPFTPHIVEEEE